MGVTAYELSPILLLMQKGGWVYILTNKHHTVLYTGVTSNLVGRMLEHRGGVYPSSFTKPYNTDKLVYYSLYDTLEEAIDEEKRVKAGSRSAKLKLIEQQNPRWEDLWLKEVSRW